MTLIKLSFLTLFYTLGISIAKGQAWPKTQTFGNDTLSIVTTADCDSRHEGSMKAVLDVKALPGPVGPEQRVALYRLETDGRFHHSYYDDETPVGYVFERLDLLAREYKLRWYYDENCYVEVPFTISNTPPIEAELVVEQSTEAASCKDGEVYLTINRPSADGYHTIWQSNDESFYVEGLRFPARNPYFKAGNWTVQLYGSEGCDLNLGYDFVGNGPFPLPIAEFDFTIECCIKNPMPPSIAYVSEPSNCDSSNGGFTLLEMDPPANNLGVDAYEWIIADVQEKWVPPKDGDSGPYYDGLAAGIYTIEAITDEMYDDDVFEGCEMPTKTFRLGEDCK